MSRARHSAIAERSCQRSRKSASPSFRLLLEAGPDFLHGKLQIGGRGRRNLLRYKAGIQPKTRTTTTSSRVRCMLRWFMIGLLKLRMNSTSQVQLV